MTLTQITFFFLGVLAVLVTAMMVHTYLDKRTIRKSLNLLTTFPPGERLLGAVLQESQFHYPRFHGKRNGRTFDLFFDVVKVGRRHILYSIYSLAASLPHSLLFINKETFKPITNEVGFTEANGALLTQIDLPFQGRSKQPEWAQRACHQGGVKELLQDLHSFSSLQFGPDALVVGKPYEGLSDTDQENVLHHIKTLEKLAALMEQCPT